MCLSGQGDNSDNSRRLIGVVVDHETPKATRGGIHNEEQWSCGCGHHTRAAFNQISQSAVYHRATISVSITCCGGSYGGGSEVLIVEGEK